MKEVAIDGTNVALPRLCACCLRDATHEVTIGKVQRTELIVASIKHTLTLKVPLCEPCSRHVTWSTSYVVAHAIALGVVLFFVGLLVCLGVVVSYEPPQALETLIFLAGAGLFPALGGWAYAKWKGRNRPDDRMGPEHVRRQTPLEILDFTQDKTILRIHNDRYAEAVSSVNPVIQPGATPLPGPSAKNGVSRIASR